MVGQESGRLGNWAGLEVIGLEVVGLNVVGLKVVSHLTKRERRVPKWTF